MLLHIRHEAEIAHMERVLRSHGGVLTRERLFELCGAIRWPVLDSFPVALDEACVAGRIQRLGDELVELPTGWALQ